MALSNCMDSLSITFFTYTNGNNDIIHIFVEEIKYTMYKSRFSNLWFQTYDSYGTMLSYFFPEMFESGVRYLGCWTFLCVQKKCYNLWIEELDFKAQQHSMLSASSQNHFTSFSWNWNIYPLVTGLSKTTSSKDYFSLWKIQHQK